MKTAIVTGASKGIGLAISKKLLEKGWQVIGIAREFTESLSSSFIPYPIDLTKIRDLPAAFKKLLEQYPEVDALICNAGRGIFGSLEQLSFEDISSAVSLNFLSHTYLVKTFLPSLKKKNRGHVVFIGSEAALQGKKEGSIYCATKFALRGFSQSLREECATSNIRVSLINPGMVQTNFFDALYFTPGTDPLEHIFPEDVAEATIFLLDLREGTVVDELNLSPQKKKIIFSGKNR